jgi:hypothetical protein
MRIFYPGQGPIGAPTLRLDQLEAIYRIKREITDPTRSGAALLGAGMGSGKTVVSCEVLIKSRPHRALIVGVRDAYKQWATALRDQQVTAAKVPLLQINAKADGMKNLAALLAGEPGVFYVGLEFLRAQDWEKVSETYRIDADIAAMFGGDGEEDEVGTQEVTKQKFIFEKMPAVDILISDEAHKHSNQKTSSLKTMNSINTRTKIALSGTFFGNKFENAWSLTTWLWGKSVIGTKRDFEIDFCVKLPVMSKDGKRQLTTASGFPISKIKGERNPGDFVETLPCYVFIATPIGDVPEPEVVKIPLGPEQARQYREMESQSLTWIPTEVSATRQPLIADLPITQRIRLRTAALGAMTLIPGIDDDDPDKVTFAPDCESTTLNAAYDVLHRPTWQGKKVLILTHSLPFANEVARRIGRKYKVALKTGEVSSKQWEEDKTSFMLPVSETGSVQYLVAIISAVGTAMDGLQANCAKVLWLSEDENNVNNIQGGNRVWREGVDLDEYEAVKLVQQGTIAEGVLSKNDSHRESVLDSVKGTK